MLGQLRQSRRARCVQMIQNAGLVFGDGISSFVLAHMLTMAGEKDGWIGLQETSDSRVEHRWEGVANGLSCQTKCAFRQLRRFLDEWRLRRLPELPTNRDLAKGGVAAGNFRGSIGVVKSRFLHRVEMHMYHQWKFRRTKNDDGNSAKSSIDVAGIAGCPFGAVHHLRVGGDGGASLAGG